MGDEDNFDGTGCMEIVFDNALVLRYCCGRADGADGGMVEWRGEEWLLERKEQDGVDRLSREISLCNLTLHMAAWLHR